MAKRILVVGGAGYVGGAITDRLIEAGHQVRVYDALLYEESYFKPVDFVFGDVRDRDKLLPLLRWADAVVWLAALVGDGACALDPELTRAINVDSVAWLREHFPGRILFMSTCSVYGAMDGILTEESATNPLSLYAETKLEAERILADSDAISFRLGTLFGLGDTYSRIRMDLVVNTLTVKACLYKKISVFGGNQFRPLLHVRDVAEAVVANVDTRHRGIFNLQAKNMKIVDIAELLAAQVPDLQIVRTEMKFQDARNYSVSSRKAEEAFGFAPKRSVEEGIAEMRRLVVEGRICDISSARFSNNEFLRPLLVTPHNPLGYEIKTAARIRR
ncbi:MAG: NAD-dependent dehydratase [Acidobacteria bacterium]|nr:MAG: NAD-dependent dehydratase [Acidobacteriota bacterium]